MSTFFKEAMRRVTSTVNVITASDNGVPSGMTATAVTSLCMDPASLLICINKSASINPIIGRSKEFCVNILAAHHAEISGAFSGQKPRHERFDVGDWRYDLAKIPYLADAQANIFCLLEESKVFGTHEIFIGRVTDVKLFGDANPLVYGNGAYHRTLASTT